MLKKITLNASETDERVLSDLLSTASVIYYDSEEGHIHALVDDKVVLLPVSESFSSWNEAFEAVPYLSLTSSNDPIYDFTLACARIRERGMFPSAVLLPKSLKSKLSDYISGLIHVDSDVFGVVGSKVPKPAMFVADFLVILMDTEYEDRDSILWSGKED